MTLENPKLRISLEDARNHPWTLREELPSDEEVIKESQRVHIIQ